jgi:hypothetical protein
MTNVCVVKQFGKLLLLVRNKRQELSLLIKQLTGLDRSFLLVESLDSSEAYVRIENNTITLSSILAYVVGARRSILSASRASRPCANKHGHHFIARLFPFVQISTHRNCTSATIPDCAEKCRRERHYLATLIVHPRVLKISHKKRHQLNVGKKSVKKERNTPALPWEALLLVKKKKRKKKTYAVLIPVRSRTFAEYRTPLCLENTIRRNSAEKNREGARCKDNRRHRHQGTAR